MKRNPDPISDGEVNTPPKRRKNNKSLLEYHHNVDSENSIDLAIGRMNDRLLADYIARLTKLFRSDLSPLELHDLTVPGRGVDSLL
jgi:hypothetical protein